MRECTIDDLIEAHPSGAVVLDVREDDEYESGHVPGALHIPMNEVATRISEVPEAHPVYVICASGNRSRTSATVLGVAGRDAVSVQGGTKGWIAAGQPVIEGRERG